MSRFNQLVRDNVENINVGNRYLEISQMFDSIREDSKTLINQLQDGRISVTREDAEPLDEAPPRHALEAVREHRRHL